MAAVTSGLRTYAATWSVGGRSGSRPPTVAGVRDPGPAVADPTGDEPAAAWCCPPGSLAATKMAMSHANSVTTGMMAMMVSCQAESAVFGYIGLLSFWVGRAFRIGQPVTYRYDALDVPGFGHDVAPFRRGFRVAFEEDNAVPDGHIETVRIGEEFA